MVWSPHNYIASANRKYFISDKTIVNAIKEIEFFGEVSSNSNPATLISLNHLAERTGVSYYILRKIVERKRKSPYRKFYIKKRSGGKRLIHVPETPLSIVQRWINSYILSRVKVHDASWAFMPGSSIYKCAQRHCGARWLIKLDLVDFFESISEIHVYRSFLKIGYQPLVAFELARILTINRYDFSENEIWKIHKKNTKIRAYNWSGQRELGYLPQGAPTSPMMSNIIMIDIDDKITQLAKKHKLVYTRYSDDITFSTNSKIFDRKCIFQIFDELNSILYTNGFSLQKRKTKIISPGSKKIVLGLNVDSEVPLLTKKFKNTLRAHLYYIKKFGAKNHVSKKEFKTILGMKSHIRGLIDFANMVEPNYALKEMNKFKNINWSEFEPN